MRIAKLIGLALGITAAVLQIVYRFGNPFIGIGVISAIILVIVLMEKPLWKSVELLATKEDVCKAVQELVQSTTEVLFCGNLDESIFKILVDAFNKGRPSQDVGSPRLSLKILNCSPDFYVSIDAQMRKNLLDMDAKYHDHTFSHKFHLYKQSVNFVVGKCKGKQKTILFFSNLSGVYIRRGLTTNYEDLVMKDACSTINMDRQLNNISNVAEKTLEFWSPLQNGWFHPVFPPDDVGTVREEWRRSIMEWFNEEAKEILINGGELRVTWNIVKKSGDDASKFSDWLNVLKSATDGGPIKVKRYMLISVSRYRRESEYRMLTDNIVNSYLPTLPRQEGDNYAVYFLNSDSLPENIRDDFAVFVLPTGDMIAQDSISDIKDGVEVLRILFSRDFQFINIVQNKFERLLQYHPKHTLMELTT